ncbi:MAG: HisA/HisF-related TIM barrel protein [Rubricoccaceae bacterium]|nr:HisA/HisF-related TIM barrel protein [Rubricoccaceae bacterium]
MPLVIPAIDLRHGHCVRYCDGREEEAVYFHDPVRMAKLWRVQNAKVLHLMDRDPREGEPAGDNREVIAKIAAALDIPVQVGGRAFALEDVADLLNLGVYRVEIASEAARDADFVEEAVRQFGSSRVVVGVPLGDDGALDHAAALEARGVRRFVAAERARSSTLEGPPVQRLRALVDRLGQARVTAAGGVGDYRDLLALQPLAPRVDSVIVARALYENRFPCQRFWCWHDLARVDLERFSTAPLS